MSLYHQILGVPETASLEDIKKRYRELCKLYHPDVSDEDSIEKMALVNEAYKGLIGDKNPRTEIKKQIRGENNSVTIYKDQAYAYYKQGIKFYNEVMNQNSINYLDIFHDLEDLRKYEGRILSALYYFNIVCSQFESSEWFDDAVERIRKMNRARSTIRNIEDYKNRYRQ